MMNFKLLLAYLKTKFFMLFGEQSAAPTIVEQLGQINPDVFEQAHVIGVIDVGLNVSFPRTNIDSANELMQYFLECLTSSEPLGQSWNNLAIETLRARYFFRDPGDRPYPNIVGQVQACLNLMQGVLEAGERLAQLDDSKSITNRSRCQEFISLTESLAQTFVQIEQSILQNEASRQ